MERKGKQKVIMPSNTQEFVVGEIVSFGRISGEQTLGEVVKVNRKSLKVKTLEGRGRGRAGSKGAVWRVDPSLCSHHDGEHDGAEPKTKKRRPYVASPRARVNTMLDQGLLLNNREAELVLALLQNVQ